jgi:putative addiction module component (TIGR02574 family)
MTSTTKSLAQTAVLLPAEDRAYLAERLLASLEDTQLEAEWASEATQRRDDVRSGRVKPVEAEEVDRRIESLLGQ